MGGIFWKEIPSKNRKFRWIWEKMLRNSDLPPPLLEIGSGGLEVTNLGEKGEEKCAPGGSKNVEISEIWTPEPHGVTETPRVGLDLGHFGPVSFEQICVALGVMSKMQLSLILHFVQENLVQRFGWKISEKASRAIRHLRKLASESSPPVGEGKIPKGKFLEPDSVPQAKRPKYKNPPMGQHGAVAPPPFEENLDPRRTLLVGENRVFPRPLGVHRKIAEPAPVGRTPQGPARLLACAEKVTTPSPRFGFKSPPTRNSRSWRSKQKIWHRDS